MCQCQILDHEKLGYDLTAIIEVTSIKGKIAEVEKHISKFSNVCAVYDIGGLTDMIVVAKFRNRGNFVKKDLSLPYVERTNTHIVKSQGRLSSYFKTSLIKCTRGGPKVASSRSNMFLVIMLLKLSL